jgi:hypothetical protein
MFTVTLSMNGVYGGGIEKPKDRFFGKIRLEWFK